MGMSSGVAAIYTTLSNDTPKNDGVAAVGTDSMAAHGDHIHKLIFPFGIFVSGGYPQMETTSTLCYVYIPSGKGLYWDSAEEYLYIG